jgi:hypothetical protein
MARTIYGSGIMDPGYRLIIIEKQARRYTSRYVHLQIYQILYGILQLMYRNKRFYVQCVFYLLKKCFTTGERYI